MTPTHRPRHALTLTGTLLFTLAALAACDVEPELLDDIESENLEEELTKNPAVQSNSDEVAPAEAQLMDQDMIIELVEPDEDVYGYDLSEEESLEIFGPDYVEYEGIPGLGPNGLPTNIDEVTMETGTVGLFKVFWQDYWFGGDLFSASYDIIRGPSDCGGRRRSHVSAYVDANMGHAGSCFWLGWVSTNEYDCRARIRINRPGWYHWGICQIDIYAHD